MTPRVVGIPSPGDMGSAIGRVLQEHGLEVVTCLEGRSELTRLRAREAGFREVASYDDLVREADLLLSVLVPSEALAVAGGGALGAELEGAAVARQVMRGIPSMPRRARRWIGEMEEIAKTFEDLGLTPLMLQGAADLYRLVGETPLADQTSREPDPSLAAVLGGLAERVGGEAPS